MSHAGNLAQLLEEAREAIPRPVDAGRRQEERRRADPRIDQTIPLAVVENAPDGWLRPVLAAHARPIDGRPPNTTVTLDDGRKIKGWMIHVAETMVVVLDRRTPEAIEEDARRRAATLRQ